MDSPQKSGNDTASPSNGPEDSYPREYPSTMAGPSDVEETSGTAVSWPAVFLNPHTRSSLLEGSGSDVVTGCHRMCHPLTSFVLIPSSQENFLILTWPPCTDLLIETVSGIIVFLMVS